MARKAMKYVRPGEEVPELPPEEKTPEAIAAQRGWQIRTAAEPIAKGARGLLREAYLLESPWGFRLEDFQPGLKVEMLHGDNDVNVPVSEVQCMRERLPRYHLKVKGNDNHYTICEYGEDIFTTIMNRQQEQ